jgi:putative toxin-antitoxin system antitoxin component (TIGR02293 family)
MPHSPSRRSAKPTAAAKASTVVKTPPSRSANFGAGKSRSFSWSKLVRPNHLGFADLFVMPSLDRADLVRGGAPSTMVNVISREMEITKDRFVRIMGLPRATVARKIANKSDLSADESERLVGLAKLIGQVEAIVGAAGAPEGFKPARWFGEWMSQSLPALGGRRPEDLLDTADGRELVSKLLAQMESGAYA